jgi:epsilon-lactone hydrolase
MLSCLKARTFGIAVLLVSSLHIPCALAQQGTAQFDENAVARLPQFQVPYSALASPEAKVNFLAFLANVKLRERRLKGVTDPNEIRHIVDESYLIPTLQKLRRVFIVEIKPETIGGVQTDVITPQAGVDAANRDRVLINLHGGGFMVGARYGGQIESVPIAHLAAIKVISVDYRMAPEARFPAASEDVAKVYAELLKRYRPENIGIYGCSAGAMLTAQSLAWFQTHNLPRPGAVAMLSGGGIVDRYGDSGFVSAQLGGYALARFPDGKTDIPYMSGTDAAGPLASPGYYDSVLKEFPPSLLISGTRDMLLSSVVYTHSRLVAVGADADLHVFEGAQHCFTYWQLPESRQAWNLIAKFFDQHLGKSVGGPPQVDDDGTVHISAFTFPESAYLSAETRAALKAERDSAAESTAVFTSCPSTAGADRSTMPAIRECQARMFYRTALYKSMRARYAVQIEPRQLGAVYTEIFTPSQGIARRNVNKILINVHGGGFFTGSRTLSHLESIPIAATGRIKVISVDYRMAPEYTFPAATDDLLAVYREVLKTYRPSDIGLYGCSAGAALTAQAIARFQKEKLPLPAAIGMFCYGAGRALDNGKDRWLRSDSGHLDRALTGRDHENRADVFQYSQGVDLATLKGPLYSPGDYDGVMAQFPPTLLITGGRDPLSSSVLVTHAQLVRLGVTAELHMWEGMGHAFHYDPALPESREAYEVIVKFFDKYLGRVK